MPFSCLPSNNENLCDERQHFLEVNNVIGRAFEGLVGLRLHRDSNSRKYRSVKTEYLVRVCSGGSDKLVREFDELGLLDKYLRLDSSPCWTDLCKSGPIDGAVQLEEFQSRMRIKVLFGFSGFEVEKCIARFPAKGRS